MEGCEGRDVGEWVGEVGVGEERGRKGGVGDVGGEVVGEVRGIGKKVKEMGGGVKEVEGVNASEGVWVVGVLKRVEGNVGEVVEEERDG